MQFLSAKLHLPPLPCQSNRAIMHEEYPYPVESSEPEFLLAFGPADHHYESDEDEEEACSYVLGYN